MTHTKFPNGLRPAQRLNVDLAEKSGQWRGNKSGNTWTHRVDLQEGAYFSQAGKYTLTISQYMREDSLPHLNTMRFAIEATQLSRNQVELKQGDRPKDNQKKYLIR
jgi:gliding motility-associated lipoprotein GldH